MKTADLYKQKTVLSYEVFPPRPSSSVQTVYQTINELKALEPDFISVTYGARGSLNHQDSFQIAAAIRAAGLESVAHLPCLELTRQDLYQKLEQLQGLGIENILALRGDLPAGQYRPGDFPHAADMIAFIKAHGNFNILAACYPEGHIECPDRIQDIRYLKAKVDAGADRLISQLFFDNDHFYAFMERCQLAGIQVPIAAGIMPVINKSQIEHMTSICGVELPRKFSAMMARYEHNPVAMRDAGIAYAVDQIVDLIAQGAAGIHLYTMNNPLIARRIHAAIQNLI
ncbi:methylenetetrahydrofolate reductase [NAD(P)H] [Oscillospiraceae bacterium HV4-5-C5C]|nr:methylenetetrahydrofolate reductase [NAD(P)H] [Oscillospiraceae bacterium HV4-5-C5C]